MSSPDFDHLDDELQPTSNPSPQSGEDSDELSFFADEVNNTDDEVGIEAGDTFASALKDLDSPGISETTDSLMPETSPREFSLEPATEIPQTPSISADIATPAPEALGNDLTEELESVRAELSEAQKSELEARAKIEELEATIQTNSLELAEAKHNSDSSQRELDAALSTIKRLEADLAQIATERLISERTNALVTLGLESNLSFETATKFSSLNADEFDSIIRLIRSASPTN